jgi:hypothetical protein
MHSGSALQSQMAFSNNDVSKITVEEQATKACWKENI